MPQSVGQLAIIISGNAGPFNRAIQNVKNTINQAGRDVNNNTFNIRPPSDPSSRLQWGSFGRIIRSALVMGFGGGLAGALVGVGAMAFGQMLEGIKSAVMFVGQQAAMFLKDAFEEGMKLSRLELGLKFLAGGEGKGLEWMRELRSLSEKSGLNLAEIGAGFRQMAGSTSDLNNVIPRMRAIMEIGTGIGADAEQMHRFALAIAQVIAAGRFEAQELNQLTEAGLPIKELADTAAMSVGEFRAAVKDGAVSVTVLDQTLNRLALSPGGRFFGVMNAQAQTAMGQVMQVQQQWLLFKQELGKGIIEGLKETGWLDALQNGLKFVIDNKNQIGDFLNQLLEVGKQLAITFARIAGHMHDMAELARGAGGAVRGVNKALGDPLDALFGGGLANRMMFSGGKKSVAADVNKTFHGGTAEMWARDVAEAFRNRVVPKADESLRQISILPEPAKLSAEAQKLTDAIRDAIKKGLTPGDEFANTIRLLREAFNFRPAQAGAIAGKHFKVAVDTQRRYRDLVDEFERDALSGAATGAFDDAAAMRAARQWAETVNGVFDQNALVGGIAGGPGAAGLFAPRGLDQRGMEVGLYQAFLDAEKALVTSLDHFPKAMQMGSAEAVQAINKAAFGSGQESAADRLANVMRLSKEATERMEKDVKDIAAAARALKLIPVN